MNGRRCFFDNYRVTYFRACLHRGGGPHVGEVTHLIVVEKQLAFMCNLRTPRYRCEVTRGCSIVAKHVKRQNGGQTTHLGCQCTFLFTRCSCYHFSMLWLFIVTLNDAKPPPKAINCSGNAAVARLRHMYKS